MKYETGRIKHLIDNLGTLIEKEEGKYKELISTAVESIKILKGDTLDRRFNYPISQLALLQEHLNDFEKTSRSELARIAQVIDELEQAIDNNRIEGLIIS